MKHSRPRLLAEALLFLAPLVPLGFSSRAHAQFANKSLGLSTGYLRLDGVLPNTESGLPVGLRGSLYLEHGFEAVAQAGILVVHDSVANLNRLAMDGPSLGARYLFLEEGIRPYLGVDLCWLHVFPLTAAEQSADFFGVGPHGGVELFLSDSISVSLDARFNTYVSLNQIWFAWGATLATSAHF